MYGGFSLFMFFPTGAEKESSDQCIPILKNEADKMGVAGLRLYVETNNKRAQKTYEALGMQSEHYTMYEWLKE